MAVWIHDSLDSWQFGFMAVWIHGNLDSWQFGFMAVWIHGSLDSWLFTTHPPATCGLTKSKCFLCIESLLLLKCHSCIYTLCLHNVQYAMSNVHCPMYNVQYPINVQGPMSIVQCPMSNVQSPMSNVQCPCPIKNINRMSPNLTFKNPQKFNCYIFTKKTLNIEILSKQNGGKPPSWIYTNTITL